MKMLFMGRKKYAAQMLQWSIEQGITVAGIVTDSHYSNSPTALIARQLSIPLLSIEEAEHAFIENPNFADVVVSYLFWKVLKEPLISTPLLGCINFHPAILPDWKGCGGYNIAILNKLYEWGASAHYVDESIDTGPIIRVFKFSFDYRQETAQSLEKKTQRIQCDLFKSVILDLMSGYDLRNNVIENIGGNHISKQQMLDMMPIDINNDDIDNKIRAFWFPPYSGATIEINEKKYTLVNDFILSQLKEEDQTFL